MFVQLESRDNVSFVFVCFLLKINYLKWAQLEYGFIGAFGEGNIDPQGKMARTDGGYFSDYYQKWRFATKSSLATPTAIDVLQYYAWLYVDSTEDMLLWC